ncbi:MAG: fumarylacetoacetate hydrolase family protein [Candidatus Eremiobacteraeota bacterium]|nr:fumarylacetoacetate hydrolase family protein [Candidatus Eremiobacteraeota bacterium]
MKYLGFYHEGRVRPGIVEGERVREITCDSLIDYIGIDSRERARYHGALTVALRDARLAAPIRPRKNVFCVGRNYLEHAKEGARAGGRELKLPDVPTFFTKAPTAIADPDATLELQARISPHYDYEAELAVIIGKTVRDVSEADAFDAVFGYACLNDLTARDLQRAHLQWFKGKSLDHSCPIGPWIVGKDDLPNPGRLSIELRLNGERRQFSNTSQMIFPIPNLIAELSKGMTLEPGDIIATGTPDGVGFARTPPEFLKDGDVIEIEIAKIGVLRNLIRIT